MKNKILTMAIVILFVTFTVLGLYAINQNKGEQKTDQPGDSGTSGSQSLQGGMPSVTTFDECVAAGYPVTGEATKTCTTSDGETFSKTTSSTDKADRIRVAMPQPGATVTSPLKVTGEARGYWFFEASFPVKVYDENGKVLGVGVAGAKSDWMTNEFVPFEVSVNYELPESTKGTLVLERDNPSGLKQNEDSLAIPVVFGQTVPMQPVKLYYYDENKDKNAGGLVLCSSQGLVPVERSVKKSDAIIQDTIKLLIQGKLTDGELKAGIDTEYPLYGLALDKVVLERGTLTLFFNDPNGETSGGSCRVSILRAQIEATAKQFEGVKYVDYWPYNIFQP